MSGGDLAEGNDAPGADNRTSVPRGHREAREHRPPVGRGRAEACPSQRLGRLLLPPEHHVGTGQALVRGAEQQDRELVTDRKHELQVGDHLLRPSGILAGSKARLGQACAGQQSPARARPRKYCGRPKSMVAALSSLVSAAATSWPARTWKKPRRACAVASAGFRSDRS